MDMNNIKNNQKTPVCVALLGLFGASLLMLIVVWVSQFYLKDKLSGLYDSDSIENLYKLRASLLNIFGILTNFTVCVTAVFVVKSRRAFNNILGQVFAGLIIVLYALYGVDHICALGGEHLLKITGNDNQTAAFVLFSLVPGAIVIAYVLSLRSWMPAKVVGTLAYVLTIVEAYILKMISDAYAASNAYAIGSYDYNHSFIQKIQNLDKAYFCCSMVELVVLVIALFLVGVWMSNRTTTIPVQQQN